MSAVTSDAPDQSTTKLRSAADAVAAFVSDGAHIAVGGCLYSRTPMALLTEVLRQRRRGLTLSRSLTCYEAEMFLAVGAADAIETAWIGFGGPWGMARVMRERVETGTATFAEYSHLGIALRYKAAAMGVPFLPMRSMLGSSLIDRTDVVRMDCPITGQTLAAVPAVEADVAVIHAHRSDEHGNVQIDGYLHMDADIARAASHVIVSVEEVVPAEAIRARPDRTVIPHFAVDAVVHVPHGAWPHEVYGLYDAGFGHFDEYARLAASGTDGVTDYVRQHVLEVADHGEFLDRFAAADFDHARTMAKDLT